MLGTGGGQKKVLDTLGVTDRYELLCVCWEPNPNPLEE